MALFMFITSKVVRYSMQADLLLQHSLLLLQHSLLLLLLVLLVVLLLLSPLLILFCTQISVNLDLK